MTEEAMIYELSHLLRKVTHAEELVEKAEVYFDTRHHMWSPGAAAYFLDVLERKRDLISYEWDRIRRMGEAIASGREYQVPDI